MKREIVTSTCECCYTDMIGILHKSIDNSPYLFECILCNPQEFELAYEDDKRWRSSNSQNEQSSNL